MVNLYKDAIMQLRGVRAELVLYGKCRYPHSTIEAEQEAKHDLQLSIDHVDNAILRITKLMNTPRV